MENRVMRQIVPIQKELGLRTSGRDGPQQPLAGLIQAQPSQAFLRTRLQPRTRQYQVDIPFMELRLAYQATLQTNCAPIPARSHPALQSIKERSPASPPLDHHIVSHFGRRCLFFPYSMKPILTLHPFADRTIAP